MPDAAPVTATTLSLIAVISIVLAQKVTLFPSADVRTVSFRAPEAQGQSWPPGGDGAHARARNGPARQLARRLLPSRALSMRPRRGQPRRLRPGLLGVLPRRRDPIARFGERARRMAPRSQG